MTSFKVSISPSAKSKSIQQPTWSYTTYTSFLPRHQLFFLALSVPASGPSFFLGNAKRTHLFSDQINGMRTGKQITTNHLQCELLFSCEGTHENFFKDFKCTQV